jgi:hypothetical protein
MKISGIIFSAILALTLSIGFSAVPTSTAQAGEFKGKIESVKREGRNVMIGGKAWKSKRFPASNLTTVRKRQIWAGLRARPFPLNSLTPTASVFFTQSAAPYLCLIPRLA